MDQKQRVSKKQNFLPRVNKEQNFEIADLPQTEAKGIRSQRRPSKRSFTEHNTDSATSPRIFYWMLLSLASDWGSNVNS